ncbi:N-acyl-phosphatidylethanolamine-hydrolyzing phospholipase D-like [Clytia hemisphaerica]|uniref:Metallo-beta-lactamase domain-containing protein n=1 Tax=Clytia hemisphaerica TaxID=252671 RepID=A0A7M5WYA5_9CNID
MFKTVWNCRSFFKDVNTFHRHISINIYLCRTLKMSTETTPSMESEKYPLPKLEDGRFQFPWGEKRPGVHQVLWGFYKSKETSGIPSKQELDAIDAMKIQKLDTEKLFNPPSTNIQATWLGHASYLIQFAGINVIFDPVFGDRIGPATSYGVGQARYRKCPVTDVSELPPIDIVCVSHDHYDHLDRTTVERLQAVHGDTIHWFLPLKFDDWMNSLGLKNVNVKTFNWWDEDNIEIKNKSGEVKATIAFVPAQHWCLRGLTRKGLFPSSDENTRLWGGWIVKSGGKTIYHAGDTGYCHIFKSIGERYGEIDLSLLPIGAYTPREVLKFQHINPEEAVMIHQDVRSKQSLGMHWGTFELTKEPYLEPPDRLKKAMEEKELNPEHFIALKHGETKLIGDVSETVTPKQEILETELELNKL